MKETHKARQAFEDYYGMGPNRSTRKLLQLYLNDVSEKKTPTKYLTTLLKWSKGHSWQDRCKERDDEIAQAVMDELKATATKTGYALYYKRIADLGTLADKLYQLLGNPKDFKGKAGYTALIKEFRGLLADIASEMGDRTKKVEINVVRQVWETMEQLGLTLDDIKADQLAHTLFATAGIEIANPKAIGTDSAEQGDDKA